LMVDSERGLGRPERALELARSVPRGTLPIPVQVELAIAMSGARLDLGQPELALAELEIPQLDPDVAFSWSPGLFDAYATVLEELGRADEAAEWYRRADVASAALTTDEDDEDFIEVFEDELLEADASEGDDHDADDGAGSAGGAE
ncbi:MAG TPA: primosomal protein, partial [Microbacteriaceae bacterium]|nr:primosomal protein [Microbacteriaceae bacterium]